MESSRTPEDAGPPPEERRPGRRFTLDALAAVLSAELHLTVDTPLYVAYSGGMDSHVLLHALAGLRARAPWRVAALHIDHGLQPDSAEWSRHCASVCAALNVPYRSERVSVGDIADRGIEDAARRARYAALRRLLPDHAVLLTAHHRNDQAETVLLQLLRGAGVPGLAAMPAVTGFAGGRLARPLLGFERVALAEYAVEHGLRWIEDASNRDTGPARNFLRRRVWPIVTERWPHAAERIARAAHYQGAAARLLDDLARIDFAMARDDAGGLKISAVQALSPERQANLVRYWVRSQGRPAPPEPVLREILERVTRDPRTRHAAVCWPDTEVRRYRDRLVLLGPIPAAPRDWQAVWEPDTVLRIPGSGWQLCATAAVGAGIARSRIAGKTLQVRLRRGGERCRLRGHRHKVKKLLQEAGIPPWERGHWPLVYVDGDLAAIGDRWVCEPYEAHAGEAGLALALKREND